MSKNKSEENLISINTPIDKILPNNQNMKQDILKFKDEILREIKLVKKSFTEIYNDLKICIKYEPNIEQYCSRYIFNNKDLKNRGARAIYDVLGDDLKSKIFINAETIKSENKNTSNKDIYVSFDNSTNEFVINNENFITHKKEAVITRKKNNTFRNIIIILFTLILIFVIISRVTIAINKNK